MKIRKWKKQALVIIMIISMLATMAACSSDAGGDGTDESGEKTIVYALNGAWNRLMPYDIVGLLSIIPNEKIFDRLCGFDNDNIIYYRAAESIDLSEDQKVFTVHLRKDSKWHDGEPVTAYDWEWTFKTMAQPEFEGYGSRGYLAQFAGTDASGTGDIEVKALDDYTLEMHVKSPTTPEAFFGSYSYYYYVLPKHLLEDIPVDELGTCDFWDNPVGSGPCKFVSETPGYEVVVEAFDDYYLGRPQFDKLIYRVISDKTLSSGLLAGEFDTGWDAPIAEEAVETLDGNNGLHAELMDNKRIVQLYLNNEKFEPEVRHAFMLAIDKQMIVDSVLKGYGSPACSPLMPSSPYLNTDLKVEYDPEKAKEMLEEAGFDFSQTYSLGVSTPDREKMAVIIQDCLGKIGVKVDIETGDQSAIITGARDGSIDMSILEGTTAASPTYLMMNYSLDGVTYSRVQDGKYYDAHVAVNLCTDEKERKEKAWELQELLYEECPDINLCYRDIYMVSSAKLDNLTVANNDKCWEWEVK